MRIPDYLVEFLASPAMILLGTRNAGNMPDVGRAMGVRLIDGNETIELLVSKWQWPGTVENISRTGILAVTLSRPSDYVTYQVKGRAAIRPTGEDDRALAARYGRRMKETLTGLGVTPAIAAQWFCDRDLVAARLGIEEIFVQTPGSSAGTAVGADA